jgi:hypothetical protein
VDSRGDGADGRPTGFGAVLRGPALCIWSALSYVPAAVVFVKLLFNSAFAADLDGGTQTANLGGDGRIAAWSTGIGAAFALAAAIRDGGDYARPIGILLFSLVGGPLAMVALTLLSMYG